MQSWILATFLALLSLSFSAPAQASARDAYLHSHITADVMIGPAATLASIGGVVLLARSESRAIGFGTIVAPPLMTSPLFGFAGSSLRARRALWEQDIVVSPVFGILGTVTAATTMSLSMAAANLFPSRGDRWKGRFALTLAAMLSAVLSLTFSAIQWAVNDAAWKNQLGEQPVGWPISTVTFTILEAMGRN